MKRFFFFALLISLSGAAYAAVIGISPSVAYFPQMIKGGYAEREFLLTTNSVENITATVEFEGEIASWMTLNTEEELVTISYDNPYKFKLIIQPPGNARNGNYSGMMRITSSPLGSVTSGAGSAVMAAVAVRINLEIIGEEIISCRAGAIQISPTEIGLPYTFSSTIHNDGNVKIRPEIVVDIYDQNGITLLDTRNFLGNQVMPMTFGRIFFAAHDRGGLLVRHFQQALDSLDKPETLHDLGIIYLVQIISAL